MRTLTAADAADLRTLFGRQEFFWLDLDDPDAETLERIGSTLGIHELALEDTRKFGQRPKLESYGDKLLLVYYGARFDDDGVPTPVEVHLHICGNFVLSVHRDRCRRFDLVREALERETPETEEIIVYRIVDALTDAVLEVLDEVANEIEALEELVFSRPRARDRDRMALLRRSLGAVRRLLATQKHVLGRLTESLEVLPGLSRGSSAYYRDVADHLARAVDDVEAARDNLQGMIDTYTNEVQERLTIVATIFLPLTVITGFFGQNFTWMINHIGPEWAFWGLGVGGLAVSITVILLWLRHSGLSHGRRR